MEKLIKVIGLLPVVALSACSASRTLNKEQTIQAANKIIACQNNGTATFSEYTYNGKMEAYQNEDGLVDEGVYVTLTRSYETPYLYFNQIVRENNEPSVKINLWIYQTSGNVIIASSNSQTNEKYYTVYPLTLENTFYDLINSTKELTDVERVEELIYSQNVLKDVESYYNDIEPRDIFQVYSFQAMSNGDGNLSLLNDFSYEEGGQVVGIHSEYSFNNYLFSSLLYITSYELQDENGDFNNTTIRQNESITYKAKRTYPDLNDFTFVENN